MNRERERRGDRNVGVALGMEVAAVASELAIIAREESGWMQVFPLATAVVAVAIAVKEPIGQFLELRSEARITKAEQMIFSEEANISKPPL